MDTRTGMILPEEQMQLPTIDEAGVIAVGLCGHLTEQQQAMFVAGFQEAIKYLMSNSAITNKENKDG